MTRFAIDITFRTGEHGELVTNMMGELRVCGTWESMRPNEELVSYDTRDEAESVAADVFHGADDSIADVAVYSYED